VPPFAPESGCCFLDRPSSNPRPFLETGFAPQFGPLLLERPLFAVGCLSLRLFARSRETRMRRFI
jgi:hypothetical protein